MSQKKTGPIRLIWHNFTNSQRLGLLIIFGRQRHYTILIMVKRLDRLRYELQRTQILYQQLRFKFVAALPCEIWLFILRLVYSDTTQLYSTSSWVELSCVAINGPLHLYSELIRFKSGVKSFIYQGWYQSLFVCLSRVIYSVCSKCPARMRWVLHASGRWMRQWQVLLFSA